MVSAVTSTSISLTWTSVSDAAEYRVYRSNSSEGPYSQVGSPASPSFEDTGLEAGTAYYYRVTAYNAGGESAAATVTGTTGTLSGPEGFVVNSAADLDQAISAINSSPIENHIITVTGSFTSNSSITFSGTGKTITIKGDSTTRTIFNGGSAAFFTVSNGITLILENNITLDGNGKSYPVVNLSAGAELKMNDGAAISGANDSGVYVGDGTFTMTGGTISGNTSSSGGGVYVRDGTFTMSGGTISGNTAAHCGGGVYVYGDGTFTKAAAPGCIIYGYDGGVGLENSADVGYAAYVYVYGTARRRNTTAGADVALDNRTAGVAGGWE
jgi:hypothetical protein